MSDLTELRCWPSCVDALDWSQDGILALASDERVELLFPNTVSYDRDQEIAQWQHVPLQVPWFTNEELPTKRPAPLANYSIGEEISSSAPIAIAWSPPGLAKHRRCALATLTANLVLSIWSAQGKQQEASSWDRRLIVNNALAEYFMTNSNRDVNHVTASPSEQIRLRSRIRAFAWAPALPNSHSSSTLGSRTSYGRHLVAVCNDHNELALMVIKSPASTYGVDLVWNAEVLTHVSLTLNSGSTASTPFSFVDMIKEQKHISHVSWSPWILRDDRYHSIIVYATNEDVRARVATYMRDSVELGDEVVYANLEMRYNGPMKWCPTVNDNDLALALFTSSGLVHLTISAHDASIVSRAAHDLDGRWDQVSGAVWEVDHQSTPRLHVSSMLSTIQSPTAVLDTTSDKLTSAGCPSWRDQLENSASLFSAKNDLKGNVKMKVWGLAISPLGDFIATCHSTHPSDMIEYGSPADRRGTVAVTSLIRYQQLRGTFPVRNVSAEGVLFTLKKLVSNTVEDGNQIPVFIEETAGKLLQMYGPIESPSDSGGTSLSTHFPKELDQMIQQVKQVALFEPETLKDRYTILASHACDNNCDTDLQRTLIAFRLCTALQYLPAALATTAFSIEIRNHHRQMIMLVQQLIEPDNAPTEPANDPAQEHSTEQIGAGKTIQLDPARAIVDTCDFCSAPIPFTDLRTASCLTGHHFPRCGLSLLAIQAPGITKYCGICSTPYLSEEFVAAQEMQQGPERAETNGHRNEGEQSAESSGLANMQANGDTTGEVENREDVHMDEGSLGRTPDQETAAQSISKSPERAVVHEQRRELPITFARVLFASFDVCLYCGGRFT